MPQAIEAPTDADVDDIARMLIHAGELVSQATGVSLSGELQDLALLQQVIDAKLIEPQATYSLQALGIAFGKVFVNHNAAYDWWMVEDEYGRDPAVRYKHTSLLVFPRTMLSKRIEDGQAIDVQGMYDGLLKRLEDVRAENYPDD